MKISMPIFLFIFSLLDFPFSDIGKAANPDSPLKYPSLYYEIQIAKLNEKTELELFFDEEVERYINLFLGERKDIFLKYLERSETYFPIFEKFLEQYKIPEEIKYLPVLESGLSPNAVSPSMAVGLWQFKEITGSSMGLRINSYVDERTNPELSTIAACKYLSTLNSRFDNWNLALLAYVSGPTTIRNAQSKVLNKNDYQELYPFLTKPAQKYLPALVAIIYLFNNAENHFI